MTDRLTPDRGELTRRRFLQGSALTGVAAFLAACSSNSGASASAAATAAPSTGVAPAASATPAGSAAPVCRAKRRRTSPGG